MGKKYGFAFGDVISNVQHVRIDNVFDVRYDASKKGYVICEPDKATHKILITNYGQIAINKDCELLLDLV